MTYNNMDESHRHLLRAINPVMKYYIQYGFIYMKFKNKQN